MKDKIFSNSILLSMIFLSVGLRLLPHLPNVAPVAGLALFSGAKVKGWKSFALPIFVMFVSDFFLGLHSTMGWVYGSFVLITLLGKLYLKNGGSVARTGFLALSSSLIFFGLTNFGVWLTSGMYTKTFSGLLECYFMGLPFLRYTMLGDMIYTAVFFGVWRLVHDESFSALLFRTSPEK